jgi:hypothetical protein
MSAPSQNLGDAYYLGPEVFNMLFLLLMRRRCASSGRGLAGESERKHGVLSFVEYGEP